MTDAHTCDWLHYARSPIPMGDPAAQADAFSFVQHDPIMVPMGDPAAQADAFSVVQHNPIMVTALGPAAQADAFSIMETAEPGWFERFRIDGHVDHPIWQDWRAHWARAPFVDNARDQVEWRCQCGQALFTVANEVIRSQLGPPLRSIWERRVTWSLGRHRGSIVRAATVGVVSDLGTTIRDAVREVEAVTSLDRQRCTDALYVTLSTDFYGRLSRDLWVRRVPVGPMRQAPAEPMSIWIDGPYGRVYVGDHPRLGGARYRVEPGEWDWIVSNPLTRTTVGQRADRGKDL